MNSFNPIEVYRVGKQHAEKYNTRQERVVYRAVYYLTWFALIPGTIIFWMWLFWQLNN